MLYVGTLLVVVSLICCKFNKKEGKNYCKRTEDYYRLQICSFFLLCFSSKNEVRLTTSLPWVALLFQSRPSDFGH